MDSEFQSWGPGPGLWTAAPRLLFSLLPLALPIPGAAQAQSGQNVPNTWVLIPSGISINPGESFRFW